MAKPEPEPARDLPPGYTVLDGKWAKEQAREAFTTFVAPIVGTWKFVLHGPRGGAHRRDDSGHFIEHKPGPDKFRS